MSNMQWIPANQKLPNPDETVLVCVRNKNKPNGIWLYDICSHDGEEWAMRSHTWENIVFWAIPLSPDERD